MWEGCGYSDAKDLGSVVIGSGMGREVDLDGEYISIVPWCCDGRVGGEDYCGGNGR